MRWITVRFGLCFFSILTLIALFSSAIAQEDAPAPPVITIDNAAALVPVYEFNFDAAVLEWIAGTIPPSDATPPPSNPPAPPEVHINAEGTRAVIITQQPNALWLVDLRAGTWRPFLISTFPRAYTYPPVIISPNFTWVSIQAVWEQGGDNFVRFWRLDDLFALGGVPISTPAPQSCEAQVVVGSTTLRAEADIAGAAIGYPLRDERFAVQNITLDNRWVKVNVGEDYGWLNWDTLDLTDSCTAIPYVLERGTETTAVALPYRVESLTFTADDRTLALSRNYGDIRFPAYRTLWLVDAERGVIIFQDDDFVVPGGALDPNGDWVPLLLTSGDGLLRPSATSENSELVDLDSNLRATLPVSFFPNGTQIASGGRWLVVPNDSPTPTRITLWAAVGIVTPVTPTMTFTSSPSPTPTAIATPRAGMTTISGDTVSALRLLTIFEQDLPVNHSSYYANQGQVFNLGFNHDGSEYASANTSTLTIWSVDSGERLREYLLSPNSTINDIVLSNDWTRVAVVNYPNEFVLMTLAEDGMFTEVFRESVSASYGDRHPMFSADGTQLVTFQRLTNTSKSRYDNVLTVRNGFTGEISYTLPLQYYSGIKWINFTPDHQVIVRTSDSLIYYEGANGPPVIYAIEEGTLLADRQWLEGLRRSESPPRNGVRVLDPPNLELVTIGYPNAQIAVLQGHVCALPEYTMLHLGFSDDSRVLVSADGCGEVRFWDFATGTALTSLEAGASLPQGVKVGQQWVFISSTGEAMLWEPVGMRLPYPYASPYRISNLELSPDGTTLAVDLGRFVAIYGIPSAAHSAFQRVLGEIVPATVNVHSAPSFDAPVIGAAVEGPVVIAGRDGSGQFVYLPLYDGWVNAGEGYLEVYDNNVLALPVRPASP